MCFNLSKGFLHAQASINQSTPVRCLFAALRSKINPITRSCIKVIFSPHDIFNQFSFHPRYSKLFFRWCEKKCLLVWTQLIYIRTCEISKVNPISPGYSEAKWPYTEEECGANSTNLFVTFTALEHLNTLLCCTLATFTMWCMERLVTWSMGNHFCPAPL
jgi:hypothetical protein